MILIVCISWNNQSVQILLMHGAHMKIVILVYSFNQCYDVVASLPVLKSDLFNIFFYGVECKQLGTWFLQSVSERHSRIPLVGVDKRQAGTLLSQKQQVFRRIRKREKSDCQLRHVCLSLLSAWNNSATTGQNFMKFDICVFFENLSRKFMFN